MKESILHLLREQDGFAAVEFAASQPDVLAALTALDELMRDLYWKQKDLAASVALGRAAAQHALTEAARRHSEHPELVAELRGKAKTFCYNLASFTWSGWGEDGIAIQSYHEAIGLDAARANVRLARELKRGDLAMSRGWWMLGAQQISARDHSGASDSFAKAEAHARAAGERGDELLAIAFARLAEFLAERSDRAKFDRMVKAVCDLPAVKDGAFFAQQVVTALKVFYAECQGLSELNSFMEPPGSTSR